MEFIKRAEIDYNKMHDCKKDKQKSPKRNNDTVSRKHIFFPKENNHFCNQRNTCDTDT